MSKQKQKIPQMFLHHAGKEKIIPTESIPQTIRDISYFCEPSAQTEKIGIDSFLGSVAVFRLYLLVQRKLLEIGEIA